MRDADYPTVSQICDYCSITREQLIPPTVTNDICRNFFLQGKCKFGKSCRFKHEKPSPEEVHFMLNKVKRFKTDPLGMKGKKE